MKRALETKFLRFAASLPGAEVIDDLTLTPEQKLAEKADVFFKNRSVVCEVKSLLTDTSEKVEAILGPHRDRPEFPKFYGEWPISEILSRLPDGEILRRELYEAISSAIPDFVRKANRQIRTTKETFHLPRAGGLLVALNDAVEILNPDVITHRVAQTLRKRNKDGSLQFPEIAGAWLISEKHVAKALGQMPGFPAIAILNSDAPHPDVASFLDDVHRLWAEFLGLPLVEIEGGSYSTVTFENHSKEAVHAKLVTLSERCRLEYERLPYLRELTDDDLLEYGGRLSDEMLLLMESDATPTVARMRAASRWADLNEELNHRRMDIRQLLACTELRRSQYFDTRAAWEQFGSLADAWDELVEAPTESERL